MEFRLNNNLPFDAELRCWPFGAIALYMNQCTVVAINKDGRIFTDCVDVRNGHYNAGIVNDKVIGEIVKAEIIRYRDNIAINLNGRGVVVVNTDGRIFTDCAAVQDGYYNAGTINFDSINNREG